MDESIDSREERIGNGMRAIHNRHVSPEEGRLEHILTSFSRKRS